MKKTLIALAALASVGAASAQSSVTLAGTVAYGVQLDRTVNGTASGRGLAVTDAFIVIKGVEDLGGGLSAAFDTKFEQTSSSRGDAPGLGATTSDAVRRTDTGVALTGGFGTVSLRNTRSTDLLTQALVAPSYLPDGIYDSSNVLSRVAIDVVTYGLKFSNGFSGSVQYLEQKDGNTTSTLAAARDAGGSAAAAYVLNAGYAAGPLAVNVAYKGLVQKVNGAKDSLELAAVYDFGVAKVGFGYDGASVEKNAVISAANLNAPGGASATAAQLAAATASAGFYKKDALGVGVSVPFGAFTVGANYAVRGKAKLAEAVAQYNFSKRTYVNASWGKQNADATQTNAVGGKESNQQYRVAVRHDF